MKKNILIVYNTMSIGGSTTSLLSILNLFDYSRYKIELLLATNTGELIELIPSAVTFLEQAWPQNMATLKRRSIRCIALRIIGTIIGYLKGYPIIKDQIMAYENARLSRKLEKEYDVAISFLENFPLNYVSKYVKAKRKVAWIHVDYKGMGFWRFIDNSCYERFDNIVFVSDECKRSFDGIFPRLKSKSVVIPNILNPNIILSRASIQTDFVVQHQYINMVSNCRIIFEHKGLDRGVKAIIRLNEKHPDNKLLWYIIGEGKDFNQLEEMIHANKLEKQIFLLGKKENPFPYIKQMDFFFLPSRTEGKPMAVTEAQMLHIPPVVANYASAEGQIQNGINGMIFKNSDDATIDAIEYIYTHIRNIDIWKNNLAKQKFDNLDDIELVYKVIEGE